MQQLMKVVEVPDNFEVCQTPVAIGGLQNLALSAHSGITSPKVRLSRKLPKCSKPASGLAVKALHMARMRRIQVWKELRPRLEHGDIISPDQIGLLHELGVTVVHNPTHGALIQQRVGHKLLLGIEGRCYIDQW